MRLLNYVIVGAALFLSMMAHSALPPLSQEEREDYSSHIVVGKVTKMKHTLRKNGFQDEDYVYTVTMKVRQVEKGARAKKMTFSFFKVAKRPEGWSGDSGQFSIFKENDHIRAYLQLDEKGKYVLINPNGFDKL